MKRLTFAVITGLSFVAVSPLAAAQTATTAPAASPDTSKGKAWGKPDVDAACARVTDTPKPKDGYQYDGKKASSKVMTMSPGKYRYPGGAMLVWPDEHYLIQLPKTRKGIFGTDGDDLLAAGGIVGGCTREQLSEAIQNNEINPESLELTKAYR